MKDMYNKQQEGLNLRDYLIKIVIYNLLLFLDAFLCKFKTQFLDCEKTVSNRSHNLGNKKQGGLKWQKERQTDRQIDSVIEKGTSAEKEREKNHDLNLKHKSKMTVNGKLNWSCSQPTYLTLPMCFF